MKVCSKGHINADSANFCKECGEQFSLTPRQSGGYIQTPGGQPYYPTNNGNTQYVNVQPPIATNYNGGYVQPPYGNPQPSQRPKMTFGRAISTCFKNYATFKGRARRSEYWYFWLFNFLINFGVGFLGGLIAGATRSRGILDITNVLTTLYAIATLLPSLAVAVRRMHDTGKSGWCILIPIYNFILTVTQGDPDTNEYGAPVA